MASNTKFHSHTQHIFYQTVWNSMYIWYSTNYNWFRIIYLHNSYSDKLSTRCTCYSTQTIHNSRKTLHSNFFLRVSSQERLFIVSGLASRGHAVLQATQLNIVHHPMIIHCVRPSPQALRPRISHAVTTIPLTPLLPVVDTQGDASEGTEWNEKRTDRWGHLVGRERHRSTGANLVFRSRRPRSL